jgi:Flp pilus assembly pilin Flp
MTNLSVPASTTRANSHTQGRRCVPPTGGGTSNMTDILMRPLVRLQVKLAELREREDGQTTTEYAILLGFLAIAIIIALFFLRNVLRDLFSDAASSVSGAPG